MNTYARLPVTFVKGEGVWLWDDRGERYLDALAGVAVCGLGHCHPRLTRAICEQAGTLIHTSNLFHIEKQERLAERLTELSGMDNAFFCNSGAEANEAAIKLARLYGHNKGISLPTIIVMERSFHGRTMATLTASGNRKVQAGFEPLLSGFVRAPYNNLEAIAQVAANNKDVVAVLVEPFQGEGGVNIPEAHYLQGLRTLCTQNGWLLMLDEVQSGIGRSGKWFAFQHSDIMPDVVTLAKGLGGGVAIGACLAKGTAAEVFKPGNHASTFGGNPLACAAAIETLKVIADEGLLEHATKLGDFMRDRLRSQLADVPGVVQVRGQGLIVGVELSVPCVELVRKALEKKLLINVTSDKVIRLLPAFVMQQHEAEQVIDITCLLIKEFLNN
ncbi:MAG: aspartate aminotransferase family protein [Nitrosomonas sp.]|uniref:aspartate aminotransferase family protein n=1 Tax=Nitrosomonas sp. TaxID=42353 RepID=UPI0025D31E56|nr:aspartate aminotransferase family protein [Nitrosomonas sp.]MCG7755790.1 aspartate aminotransferase family protein [Nitrosomonas sp.]UJO99424.1 MAG: aspartate aminotransferase family protein [Nitrosomonas sp.]UJP02631.1 MAG: aspartate aminotransferase family protein [Nitrosomonas sp.]UJP08051.1 MAG: aspartate aminotransferase family protein [Nitrosomonas sp.]